MKKRIASLWTAMVFILAAAVFAVCLCSLWFQQAQLAYSAGNACLDTEYKSERLIEELSTSQEPEGNIYLSVVDEYNKGRFSNATASAVVRLYDYSEETQRYTRFERVTDTRDYYAVYGRENVNEEFDLAADELDWYLENTFTENYYPTYQHYRMSYGQNYAAGYSLVEENEDGTALAVASVYTFSLPGMTWRYLMNSSGIQLAVLFLLCFGGAAVIALTEKKYLQSP